MDSTQLPLRFEMAQSYLREDFLRNESNTFALAAVEAWPTWPSYGLIIVGEPKSGKTHLAHILQEKSKGIFLQKDQLKNLDEFEKFIVPGKVCILEDVYPWAQTAEHSLFHLCNLIKERQAFLLITDEHPPTLWELYLADLKSRLSLFPTIQVHQPEDDLLEAILVKKMSERQVDLDPLVRRYILTYTERSAGYLIHLLDMLDEASFAHQRKITIPLVKNVMEKISF